MPVTLEFSPDVEARLNDRAIGEGLDLASLIRQIVESSIAEQKPKIWTAKELLKLTPAERTPILEAMAKEAAPLYEADLALPTHERELTAFEILNEYDPIIDEYGDTNDAR